jgi:hypothetical protein
VCLDSPLKRLFVRERLWWGFWVQYLTEIDVGYAAEIRDFEYLCFVFGLEHHFGGCRLTGMSR